eukprot:scaffold76_cov363-Pavlova_lutheri.AAC.15
MALPSALLPALNRIQTSNGHLSDQGSQPKDPTGPLLHARRGPYRETSQSSALHAPEVPATREERTISRGGVVCEDSHVLGRYWREGTRSDQGRPIVLWSFRDRSHARARASSTMYVLEDKENVAPRHGTGPTPSSSAKKRGELRHPLAPRRANASAKTEASWSKARAHSWSEEVEAFLKREEVRNDVEAMRLARNLRQDPKEPKAWKDFLAHAEGKIAASEKDVQMHKLFAWAKDTVPTSGNRDCEDYIFLWVGFVRRQMLRNEDDASETFQSLKLNRIGERSAALYVEWARLEMRLGDLNKARKRIKAGLKADARPIELLDRMNTELDTAKPCPRSNGQPPSATPSASKSSWIASRIQAGNKTMSPSTTGASHLMPGTLTPLGAHRVNGTPCASSATPTSFFLSSRRGQEYSKYRTLTGPFDVRKDRHESSSSGGGASDGSSAKVKENKPNAADEDSVALCKRSKVFGVGTNSSLHSSESVPGTRYGSRMDGKGGALPTSVEAPEPDKEQHAGGSNKGDGVHTCSAPCLSSVPVEGGVVRHNKGYRASPLDGTGTAACHPETAKSGDTQGDRKCSGVEHPPLHSVREFDHQDGFGNENINPLVTSDRRSCPADGPIRDVNLPRSRKISPQEQCPDNVASDKLQARTADRPEPSSEQSLAQLTSRSRTARLANLHAPAHHVDRKKEQDRNGSEAVQHKTSLPSTHGAAMKEAPQTSASEEQTILVRNKAYTILECVGKGGSSKVYKVMAGNRKIYALKRIKLSNRDKEAASGFLDEITLLRRLRGHHNIIQLIDAEVLGREGIILMVLEYGDIDLARLLQKRVKARNEGEAAIDDNFLRLYWQQMLEAVQTIHKERIVHSDLKPANFLFVEGQLKLIDFGIAKTMKDSNTTSIMRESQVGTLNYMSPESILSGNGGTGHKVGRPSDVWALGCIFYQMVYGHTPFSHLPFIQKLHAITDNSHEISFPAVPNPHAMDVMKRCLDRNPKRRITIPQLLAHPFLHPETVAPTSSGNSISVEQLQHILSHFAQGLGDRSLSEVSQEILQQISEGKAMDLSRLMPSNEADKHHL